MREAAVSIGESALEAMGLEPLLALGREAGIQELEGIRTAVDMGYYEVPREATAEEVAAELELDSSTVTEHLQRAERNVLTRVLS
ncbi:HTH DNA binding domain-containing protein [Halobiforma haloterrestris]|uniref:HTH DNA binding domain-containing protein n=1 Tax=Natronobacterium haloterrestre TaxID=148448 RepID=A0A1I1LBM3_NATHA|nr:helix-turn-helix domain-containing protein [Halobiforma haloterrestris]SFC70355.1 HTH DNA binding domain-containing protein [Halobiforma haloterrestris]